MASTGARPRATVVPELVTCFLYLHNAHTSSGLCTICACVRVLKATTGNRFLLTAYCFHWYLPLITVIKVLNKYETIVFIWPWTRRSVGTESNVALLSRKICRHVVNGMKRLFSGLPSRAGGSTTLSSSSSSLTVVGGSMTPCGSLSTDVSPKHEPGMATRAIKGTKWSTCILPPCFVFCYEADVHRMLMARSICTSRPVTSLMYVDVLGLRRPAIASVLACAPQHSVITQRACQNSYHLLQYLTLQIGSYWDCGTTSNLL